LSEGKTHFKEIILITCAIISAVAGYLQIIEKINIVGIIYNLLLKTWLWFVTTKIPLTWIIISIIGLKFLLKIFETTPENKLEKLISHYSHYRYIIYLCLNPIDINQLRRKYFDTRGYSSSFDFIIRELEASGGLIYEEGKWKATNEAIVLIEKYGVD